MDGRSRVRLTYENAVAMMNAAVINERIIPTLRMPLRVRASPARCLASRRSRRARRMGMVEGMVISIQGNMGMGKKKEIRRELAVIAVGWRILLNWFSEYQCFQIYITLPADRSANPSTLWTRAPSQEYHSQPSHAGH